MKPAELVHPDPRWQTMLGDKSALEAIADSWRVSEAVPEGVAKVLRIARSLFIHSYFVTSFR